jgi:PhoPQ-activated pathogenicity-related protein
MLLRLLFSISIFLGCSYGSAGRAQDAAAGTQIPAELSQYVDRPESVFDWEIEQEKELFGGKIYHLSVTSQTWQDIVWKHAILICEPAEVKYNDHTLLYVSGGNIGQQPSKADEQQMMLVAGLCKARVAMLFQVPNQPLMGGRNEDDLITESFLRYLESGDPSWPLLFPMVKSAVKAMDVVQALAQQKEWAGTTASFVITGASKRGWTSWLTPVVDKRVVATAPIVIDSLNFRAQMKHQIDTWGKYSEQIRDYTSKGLVIEGEEKPRETALRRMTDPYTYLPILQLPKLLVNGTNDPYWVADAMKFYWDDVQGPKNILQVPNAGHNLEGGLPLAMSTISAFFRHVASGTPMPALTWDRSVAEGQATLTVNATQTPVSAYAWTATSDDKDFRDEKWQSQSLTLDGNRATTVLTLPAPRHAAHFVSMQFEFEGITYSLSTLIFRD